MSEINIFQLSDAKLKSSLSPNLPTIALNDDTITDGLKVDPDTGKAAIISLEVEESIFSPTIVGTAKIRDYGDYVNTEYASILQQNLGIGGYDILSLTFKTIPVFKGLQIPTGASDTVSFDFLIYAYSQDTTESKSLIDNSTSPRLITLKLASPEFALMNYLYFEYFDNNEDMIMPISKVKAIGKSEEEEETELGKEYTKEGLVQFLVNKVNNTLSRSNLPAVPLYSENTKNWIWLKKNYNFYPWSKPASAPRLNQLIQMLAENAVHADWDKNKKAANFFFWRTMDSWNFFSLESLVKRPPVRVYNVHPNVNQAESVQNLYSSNSTEGILKSSDETDNLALLNSYAFGSNYLFVEPKYVEDPYARYLDTRQSNIMSTIYYDYFRDGASWSKLTQPEGMKTFLPDALGFNNNTSAKYFAKQIRKNRIIEKNYGYYSPGFFNRDKTVDWEYNRYDYSSKHEDKLWQTQFDITDLDGQRLLWLEKEIKKPLAKKKAEYARKKNLKERWKVYKCSICCAGDSIEFVGIGSTGGTFSFSDSRFEKAFNLRQASISNYEIVAAGSFTDVINYNPALVRGISGQSGASGQQGGSAGASGDVWTLSGMTASYNLNESPYNLTLGEFLSLEENPDNFVKYRFDLEIARHQKLIDILQKNIEARSIRKVKYANAFAGYTYAYNGRNIVCNNAGCTGQCLCPTEYPETVKIKTDYVIGAHDSLIEHEQKIIQETQTGIQKLQALKAEFIELYDKYWSRKAFFFSRNIDFSFLKSGNNLLNVKSITRRPIKGSRYEPFASYKALLGVCGASAIAGLSGSDLTRSSYYERKYDISKGASGGASGGKYPDFWASFDHPYGNFPYSEAGEERPKGPIWYKNWLVNYQITIIKPPCLNRKPPCFQGDCSCDEINLNLNMHFETFSNVKDADILTSPNQITEYAFTQLSKNCDGCKIRILAVYPASEIKLYHPWAADLISGQTGFGYEDYKDYKRSSSLFKENPGLSAGQSAGNIPPHLLLEGMESYVRVEFKTPIGTDTLTTFPNGFVDTYGSEYFMPYIVLATAGPFGPEAARTNIAVIGQDPFGFDLAVKKIKNRDDFGSMNLVPLGGKDAFTEQTTNTFNYQSPFATSSSWLKTNQNSLFYKPSDGVADLFVPNGIQDIFMASALEKSLPAKTWWDLWVSLPPIAVATFYNRHDVTGFTGGLGPPTPGESGGIGSGASGIGGPGVAFYSNNSIVAEPYLWAGDSGGISGYSGPFGCSGGCSGDLPWPLFLHPDTEQIASGAFASNVAVLPKYDLFQSAEFLTGISGGSGASGSGTILIPGASASILPNDPSNYIYKIAEFPHILGVSSSGNSGSNGKKYDSISYPVGTLIWGSKIPAVSGTSISTIKYDYNFVHEYDISRKTRYGIVQLNSDSMPSLLTLIGGVGGEIEKVQEYHKWVSRKLADWYQNSIFDNNFSAQFVVLSKQSDGCKGYPCMNPDGFSGFGGCPPSDPLCNCPCQGDGRNKGQKMSTYITTSGDVPEELVLRPDLMDTVIDRFGGITKAPFGTYGPEPSSIELQILEKQITECESIKSHPRFGEKYLGCVWDDPKSPYNCSCPCLGGKFPEYMKYNRTSATFWSTPLEAPLYRTAQMALFNANKVTIDVPGDMYVLTGDVVQVNAQIGNLGNFKRFSGNWIVSTIKHYFRPDSHMMRLTLSRELPHPGVVEAPFDPEPIETGPEPGPISPIDFEGQGQPTPPIQGPITQV